jgi:hypothetical protein
VFEPNDMKKSAMGVDLVEPQPASLGYSQSMPEHQKHKATVAGLVARASGCRYELSYLKAGKVAASFLAPGGPGLFGRFSFTGPVHLFVDSWQAANPRNPL